jgi:uncharacterized protein Usg
LYQVESPPETYGMVDRDLQAQLKGWSLTTAEIMYRMPDYRDLLQTFIWQNYDIAPRFPRLIGFLNFWSRNLDGPLHTVRVTHKSLVSAAELRLVGSEWRLH